MNNYRDSCLVEQRHFKVSKPTKFKDAVTWENQVMAFQGTDAGIGTTFLSFATAWSAARIGKQRVAYLSVGRDPRKLWRYLGMRRARVRMKRKQGWTYAQYDPITASGVLQSSSTTLLPGLTIMSGGFSGAKWDSSSAKALLAFLKANFHCCIIDLHGDLTLSIAQDIGVGADACVNVVTPLSFKQANPCITERLIRASGRTDNGLDVLVNQADSGQMTAAAAGEMPAVASKKLNVLGSVCWSRQVAEFLGQGKLQQLLQTNTSIGKTARTLLSACLNRS
ncbi:hypothetical protein [Paenibacillus senegalensis]|uniref:hypothetical protein n=1 Tax=Paenibacillus senegalensis TaxID=1465766 RepID=UPI000288D2C2|nr:hypothetical protein [Paenibacillus senegalensis]